MATERDGRLGNGLAEHHDSTSQPSSQKPWSWKIDIVVFICSLVVSAIIFGSLKYLEEKLGYQGSWPRPAAENVQIYFAFLLLVLYLLLLLLLGNCLLRIGQLHAYHSARAKISERSSPRVTRTLRFVRALFTRRILGIAPLPTLALLVVAVTVAATWSVNIFWIYEGWGTRPWVPRLGAQVAVARNLNPDGPPGTEPQQSLLDAVWKGFAGADNDPFWECYGAPYDQVSCRWDYYATLQIRLNCADITEELEFASAYSIYHAMRDLDTVPPYDPLKESRGNVSSPSVLSLNGNTFVTLSNLRSHTGPWRPEHGEETGSSKSRQISPEALKKLHRFSSFVINPVASSRLHKPFFNQTAGTLSNFHVIHAELGIDGFYDDGELKWIDFNQGETAAWECSIDTVVQEKDSYYRFGWSESDVSRTPVLPLAGQAMNRTCLDTPESCPDANSGAVEYILDNELFSIDRRITSAMSHELEKLFIGSAFGRGWRSKDQHAPGSVRASSQSTSVFYSRLVDIVSDGSWKTPEVSIRPAFGNVAGTLTWWMRRYHLHRCNIWGYDEEHCQQAIGTQQHMIEYFRVRWDLFYYISNPVVFIFVLMVAVKIAIAIDDRYFRIRLSEDDEAGGSSDGNGDGNGRASGEDGGENGGLLASTSEPVGGNAGAEANTPARE